MTAALGLVGSSGVMKTTLALLGQAHFAPGLGSRPAANFASTSNFNERLAFQAKDTLLLVDDFAPQGTQQDVARMHQNADRLIRGNANQGGRGRLTADIRARPEWYPRGGVIITGEDIPRGHSCRARALVCEMQAGDVDVAKLTELQDKTLLLNEAMAGYVAWVAGQDKAAFGQRQRELRAKTTGTHARTPENVAVMQLGIETALRFAVEVGALDQTEAKEREQEAWEAMQKLARAQEQLLLTERPAERFLSLVGSLLSSGRAHVVRLHGREEPLNPEAMGWRVVAHTEEAREVWRGQGSCIGWVERMTYTSTPTPLTPRSNGWPVRSTPRLRRQRTAFGSASTRPTSSLKKIQAGLQPRSGRYTAASVFSASGLPTSWRTHCHSRCPANGPACPRDAPHAGALLYLFSQCFRP